MLSGSLMAPALKADTADLDVWITDRPDPVVAGNQIELSFVVTNQGPGAASGLTVSYPLPVGFVTRWELFCPSSPGISATNWLQDGVISTRLLGPLDAHQSCYGALSIQATEPGMITNAVSVSAATDDPNSANNVATTVTPVQEPYGINIVRNADAESVSIPIFTWDGFRIDGQQVGLGFSLVPGWYVTSNLTVQSYGSSADLPSEDSPGPGDRGANFFAGRWAPSTADQKCDLSWIAAAVDSGGVGYSMSGYLGGAASPSARAYFQVQFFNFIGTPLGNVLLGPVTSEDRANATALLERSAVGFLPRQTRSVQFTVVTVGEVSGWGLADNLSFVLRPPDAPLLEIMPVAPDQLRLSWSTNIPGFLAQSSSTLLPQSWTTMTTDVAVSGDRFTVLLRRSATSEYFRLRKP